MPIMTDRRRAFLHGALGALSILVIVGFLLAVWILWNRSYRGELAYEYLEQIQKAQQAQQTQPIQGSAAKPTPSPSPSPKPGG